MLRKIFDTGLVYAALGAFYFLFIWFLLSAESAWRGLYFWLAFCSLLDFLITWAALRFGWGASFEDRLAAQSRREQFRKLPLFKKITMILNGFMAVCVRVIYWPIAIASSGLMNYGAPSFQHFVESSSLRLQSTTPLIIGMIILLMNGVLYLIVSFSDSPPAGYVEMIMTAFIFGAFAWLIQTLISPIEKQIRTVGTRRSAVIKFIVTSVLALFSLTVSLLMYNGYILKAQVTFYDVFLDLITAGTFNTEVENFQTAAWAAIKSGDIGALYKALTDLDFSRYLNIAVTGIFMVSIARKATLPLFSISTFSRTEQENVSYAINSLRLGRLNEAEQYTKDLPKNHFARTLLDLRRSYKNREFEEALRLAALFLGDVRRAASARKEPKLNARERWFVTLSMCSVNSKLDNDLDFALWSLTRPEIEQIDVLQYFGKLQLATGRNAVVATAIYLLNKLRRFMETEGMLNDELLQKKLRVLERIAFGKPEQIPAKPNFKQLFRNDFENAILVDLINFKWIQEFTNSDIYKITTEDEDKLILGDLVPPYSIRILNEVEELVDFENIDLIYFDFMFRLNLQDQDNARLLGDRVQTLDALLDAKNISDVHQKLNTNVDQAVSLLHNTISA